MVWTPPAGFLLALYLGSETRHCQQRNSEACLTFPEFFQVDLYRHIDLKVDGLCRERFYAVQVQARGE